jgi:hypothetical protein
VVGEHVRRGAGDEPARQRRPVVAPVRHLDLDVDARVLLLEALGALLVDGLLVLVPERVAEDHRAAGGRAVASAAAAGGERDERCERDQSHQS